MIALTRGRVALTAALGAALALVSAPLTWLTTVTGSGVGETGGRVVGSQAVPGLVPLALAVGAGALALGLADGWARKAVAVVITMCGLGLVLLSAAVTGNPAVALQDPRIAVAGVGAAPWLAVSGGMISTVGGILALVVGRRWPGRDARRVDSPRTPGRTDWEALSAGDDPT